MRMDVTRRIVALLTAAALGTAAAVAATDDEWVAQTTVRAERSFTFAEWKSAQALYELLLDRQPERSDFYARAVVAAELAGDTIAGSDLVERAMSHGIPFAPLLADIRSTSYSVGAGDGYGDFLLRLQGQLPWLARPIDDELLRYYTSRSDGPMMERYARVMLAGLPDSVEYLDLLARGYMLQDNLAAAAAVWERILALEPDNYDALISLGNYARLEGRTDDARRYLSEAYRLHPTPYLARLTEALNAQ